VRKVASKPTQSVSVTLLPIATNISSGGLSSMNVQPALARKIGEPESANKLISDIPELNKGSTSSSVSKSTTTVDVSSFTVPRIVSTSETQSIPLNVDVSKVVPVKTQSVQSLSGSINARRVGDYSTVYDSQGNRLTPTPTDIAEMKIVGALGGSQVVAGTVSGLLSPAKLGITIYSASNFNPYSENQKAVQSNIKQGVVQVVKDPFKTLVNDPVMTVVNNPLYEAPKLATELVLLEGASRGTKAIIKEVGAVNKYLGADVKASAYDLSRSSEKAQVFLKDQQINPSASSGGSEFFPIRSMTESSGVYDLAGLEVPKPRSKNGLLPFDEKPYFDQQPAQAKLVDDTLYYRIKDGEFVPSETQSGVYGDVQISKARSDSQFRSSIFDLKLEKSSRKSIDPNFVFNDQANTQDLAILGQRTIKGDVISDAKIKELNAPLYENELVGATRKTDGGFYIVPEEKLIIKQRSSNLIIPTGQTKIVQDQLIAGSLETSKQSKAFVVNGDVFVGGKEFNPKTQTLRTDPAGSIARINDPYDLNNVVVEKKSVQLDLSGQPAKRVDVVDLTTDLDQFTTDALKMSSKDNIKGSTSSSVSSTSVVDNSDKFKFDVVSDGSSTTRQVSSSRYANDKSFSNFKLSDASFDVELVSRKTVADLNPLDFPLNNPSKSRLTLSPEYVFDSGSDSFVKKVGDVELNLDIKGKVTPQRFGGVGSVSVLSQPQVQSPSIISKINVDQIQSPSLKSDLGSGLKSDLGSGLQSDSVVKSKTKITQIQSPIVVVDQVVTSDSESKFDLKLKQDSVQKLKPKSLLRSENVERVEIKPLLPTLKSERQVKSGSGLFDVLVRKEGKFVKIGSGYSDLATAFNRGKQEVKNTARASFKVVSRFGEPQKLSVGADRSLSLSKRDSNVVVQKREFRISSEGEKTEISRKGVFTQRARRGLSKKNKGIFG
jgi:hypothetical protein